MVELLLNPEDRRTKEQKCKEVGITFKSLYMWMKDKRFLDYLNGQLDKYTDGELADIWKALIRQAKMGNINAIKLYFELKGKYSCKIDLVGQINHTHSYEHMSDEELDKELMKYEGINQGGKGAQVIPFERTAHKNIS